MKELQDLLIKYETMLDDLIVMDDYDGGKAEMLRTIIRDLKDVLLVDDLFWNGKFLDLPNFESKKEEMRKHPHQDNHMD